MHAVFLPPFFKDLNQQWLLAIRWIGALGQINALIRTGDESPINV
jgi:hypothetical protein